MGNTKSKDESRPRSTGGQRISDDALRLVGVPTRAREGLRQTTLPMYWETETKNENRPSGQNPEGLQAPRTRICFFDGGETGGEILWYEERYETSRTVVQQPRRHHEGRSEGIPVRRGGPPRTPPTSPVAAGRGSMGEEKRDRQGQPVSPVGLRPGGQHGKDNTGQVSGAPPQRGSPPVRQSIGRILHAQQETGLQTMGVEPDPNPTPRRRRGRAIRNDRKHQGRTPDEREIRKHDHYTRYSHGAGTQQRPLQDRKAVTRQMATFTINKQ